MSVLLPGLPDRAYL